MTEHSIVRLRQLLEDDKRFRQLERRWMNSPSLSTFLPYYRESYKAAGADGLHPMNYIRQLWNDISSLLKARPGKPTKQRSSNITGNYRKLKFVGQDFGAQVGESWNPLSFTLWGQPKDIAKERRSTLVELNPESPRVYLKVALTMGYAGMLDLEYAVQSPSGGRRFWVAFKSDQARAPNVPFDSADDALLLMIKHYNYVMRQFLPSVEGE